MNQFKKAKQKALASGHHVENIGDLNTAGIKEPDKEETEKPKTEPEEAKEEVKQAIQETQENVISHITTNQTVEEKHDIQTEYHNEPPVIEQHSVTVPEMEEQHLIEEPISIEQQPPQMNEPIVEEPIPIPTNETYREETQTIQPESKVNPAISIEQVTYQSQMAQVTPPAPQLKPEMIQQPDYNRAVEPIIEHPVYHTEPNIIHPQTIDNINQVAQTEPEIHNQVITPQIVEPKPAPTYIQAEPEYTEQINVRKSSNSRKNIPNIFSPKSEAKSMRKSLVLKPTSVKIAENYCAKNGGSFNELIQTLLDNFIDEYGL